MAPSADPETVFTLVASEPGLPISAVARALGVDHSTATYHLRRLARAGRVVSERDGRFLRWFANGCGLCPVLRWLAPAAADPAVARLLAALPREGAARPVDLHRATGLPVPSVRWHLEKLRDRGFITEAGYGRFRIPVAAAPCVGHALAGSRCPEWGRCEMSRTWQREDA